MLRAFGHPVATCWVLFAKIWPFSNWSQQHSTHPNMVAKRTQDVTPNNVAICCIGMMRSFGRGLRRPSTLSMRACRGTWCFANSWGSYSIIVWLSDTGEFALISGSLHASKSNMSLKRRYLWVFGLNSLISPKGRFTRYMHATSLRPATTWIVSRKSNLQLVYDCCVRQKSCRRILKHV